MRNTSPIALAVGLTMFVAAFAGAQTPPPPAPTPPPTEQHPPTPEPPVTPPPGEQQPPPQTPPVTPPAEQTPPPATEPAPEAKPPSAKPRFFLSANAGFQFIKENVDTSTEFDVFDERATLSSAGELKSEPIFDAGFAYQLTDRYGVGAAFSLYVTESDVAVTARVPHPLFFDQVRVANYQAAGVKHTSTALHLNGIWFVPFTTKIDFQISAGPSIVFVKQDVVTAANLLSENPPFTEPRIDTITLTSQKKTALGFNAAVDATYTFTPRVGIGFTARYVFASADIEGLVDSLKVGGFQTLGGVRFRF